MQGVLVLLSDPVLVLLLCPQHACLPAYRYSPVAGRAGVCACDFGMIAFSEWGGRLAHCDCGALFFMQDGGMGCGVCLRRRLAAGMLRVLEGAGWHLKQVTSVCWPSDGHVMHRFWHHTSTDAFARHGMAWYSTHHPAPRSG